MRNTCFCFLRPPILASKIHTQANFFQDASLGIFLVDFMLILCAVGWFWATFKGKRALKWEPKSTKWRQNGTKIFVADPPKRVLGKTLVSLCILVSILVTGGTLLVYNWPIVVSLLVSFLRACSKASRHLTSSQDCTCASSELFGSLFNFSTSILCWKCSY